MQIGQQQQNSTAKLAPTMIIFAVVEKAQEKKGESGTLLLEQCSSSLLSPQLSNPSHSCSSGMQWALPHTKTAGLVQLTIGKDKVIDHEQYAVIMSTVGYVRTTVANVFSHSYYPLQLTLRPV